ncbi:hypothetical protein BsWGS_15763 [Bradybaena similaris]
MELCGWLTLLSACFIAVVSDGKICSRDKSRVVAKVVREKILPAFRIIGASLSPKCKFSVVHNTYSIQEDNKVFEAASRWTCNFCGKSFVSEYFLDQHFETKHGDHIQTKDAICLADVCDVFRCDIISGVSQPDYWDIALCLEDDMEELFSQCKELVEECIPDGLTQNETETLKNHVMENVCSFLTCSKFWNTLYQEAKSGQLVLYIILSTMTCFGILVYNFVFYNYFYSESPDLIYDPTPKTKHRIKKYRRIVRAIDYSRQQQADMQMQPT